MSYIQKNYVEGKVVVITGASSGFGRETALIVAEMGGIPVFGARRVDRLQALADKITAKGGTCYWRETDVKKQADVQALVDLAIEKCGKVDCIVNNACSMPLAYFADHKKAVPAWEEAIDTGIKGVIYGMCAVYDQMMEQGYGQIINIASTGANFPAAGNGVYCTIKQGVLALSHAMRHECHGKIKVSTLSPSLTMGTELASTIINPASSVALAGHLFMDNIALAPEFPGRPDMQDMDSIECYSITPRALAENIVYLINQPWGVNVSDITVRSSNDYLMV